MKRSGKFYRKNEKEVMESLGLRPTINSGSTWLSKEDGTNDYLICQLKSTDANSIRVQQKDIRVLEHNAAIEHKIPIFAIQFLNTGEVWLMAKPTDFSEVAEYINTGLITKQQQSVIEIDEDFDEETRTVNYTVVSSGKSREKFHREQESKYNKTRSAI